MAKAASMKIPRLHKEASIFDAQKPISGGIADAARKATDHITSFADGIWVTPENAKPGSDGQATGATTGWHIGDALELVKAGVKAFRVWLDNGMAKLRLGEGDRSHLDLDYHSMQMVDNEERTYFYVSDLRNADGYATVTQRIVVQDDLRVYVYSNPRSVETTSATVNGTAVSVVQINYNEVTLSQSLNVGDVVVVTYQSESHQNKAFTFGYRSRETNTGPMSSSMGQLNEASGVVSFAEGFRARATGDTSHAEGYYTTASESASHAEGYETSAGGLAAHAEGNGSNATGYASHAESRSNASGDWSHSEGGTGKLNATYQFDGHNPPTANAPWSHVEGVSTTTAAAAYASHAEGACTTASEKCAHAEGYETSAGLYAHAEGWGSTASGPASHVEGLYATASQEAAHAEGEFTEASGVRSHAQNEGTVAASTDQTALGRYNVEDANGEYAVIIGNGTADDARSNAAGLKWDGTLELAKALLFASGGTGMSGTATTTAAASVIAAASGITVTAANYAQWGKVAQLVIDFTYDQAITVPANGNIANVTVGTLVDGKRPVYFKAAHSNGDGAGQQWYGITAAGVVTLRALEGTGSQRTVAAGTTLSVSAVYLLP